MKNCLHKGSLVPKIKTLLFLFFIVIIDLIPTFIIGFTEGFLGIKGILEEILNLLESILGILLVALLCKKKVKLNEHISISGLNFKLIISIILFSLSLPYVYTNIFVCIVSFLNLSINQVTKIADQNTVEPLYSIMELILILISDAVIIPILEELLFRVVNIEILKKQFKSVTAIVIISSAIFSILHFYRLLGTIEMFILAAIMAAVYLKTNNVLYCIIAHFVTNAQSIIMHQLLTIKNIKLFNHDIVISNSLLYSLPISIIALILMIISLVLLIPILHKDKHKII